MELLHSLDTVTILMWHGIHIHALTLQKKGMAQQDEKPLVLGRGGKPLPVETVETIVVQSPGPVVNPNPTCPREPRAKQRRTKG